MRNFEESYFFNREFDIISLQTNRNNVNDKLNNKLQLPDSKAEKRKSQQN